MIDVIEIAISTTAVILYGNVIIPNLAHNEFGITELMY